MKRCFTLIEMLAVVAIIGILAGIAIGVSGAVRSASAKTQTQSTLKMLEMALAQYKEKNDMDFVCVGYDIEKEIGSPFLIVAFDDPLMDYFPDVVKEFDNNDKVTAIKSIKGIKFKTLSDKRIMILDGWDRPVFYVTPGVFNKNSCDLGSAGGDGVIGGSSIKLFKDSELKKAGTDGTLSNFITASLGNRDGKKNTDAYRKEFGKKDDITNFKNTTK